MPDRHEAYSPVSPQSSPDLDNRLNTPESRLSVSTVSSFDENSPGRDSSEEDDGSIPTWPRGALHTTLSNTSSRASKSIARRSSYAGNDEQQQPEASVSQGKKNDEPVTWMSLPKKGQLAVLTIARLSEPLSERSLAAYMFYQLRWFDPSKSDSTIASQGGMLTAAFAAAQFVTAVWWGRAADTPWIGRKRVLLVGLLGTAIASIGVGFSKTFAQAMFFRCLAGALNGNIGVMRTMLSEIIQEKKYQSRAFLLMPMCFNVGVVIGPVLGGFLADPIASFPNVFGPGSRLGGKDGVGWMVSFPYALPNLFSGIFIAVSALSVVMGLDETHEALRNKPDYGRRLGKYLASKICRSRDQGGRSYEYSRLNTDELHDEEDGTELTPTTPSSAQPPNGEASNQLRRTESQTKTRTKSKTEQPGSSATEKIRSGGWRTIFTANVLLTLASHHLLALHVSSFNALIFLLLPAPRSTSTSSNNLPFRFSGGLGLTQEKVGLAMAILGAIGLPVQILFYPPLHTRMGTLRAYRTFLPFSVLAYISLPYLVLLPERPAVLIWICLSLVLASQVLSRTFSLTGTVILVNNSSPSPAVLGTIHGVAQSVSSAARMLGPTVGGFVLGWGLKHDFVGMVWWGMAGIAVANWSLLWLIWEGDGRGGKA